MRSIPSPWAERAALPPNINGALDLFRSPPTITAAGRGGKVPLVWNGLCAMVFLAAVVFLARRSVDLGGHPLFPAVLPFLVWTGVAFVLSDDWAASFPSLQKTMAPFLFCALAALHGPTDPSLLSLFIGSGGGGRGRLGGGPVPGGKSRSPTVSRTDPVYGGFWMAVAGLVFLSFAIEATLSRRARLLSAAAAAGLMSGAVLTRSRSIVLGLLAGTAVVVLHRWGRRGAVGLAAAAALGFALLPTATVRRWSKVDDPYAFDWTLIWRGAVSGLLERPVVGWGPGRFESLYRAHAQPLETDPVRFERSTLFAHNDFLQAGATLGIPAVIFWFFGVGLFLFSPSVHRGPGPGHGRRGRPPNRLWRCSISRFFCPSTG